MCPSNERDPDILGSFRPTPVVTSVRLSDFTANASDTTTPVRYAEGECSSCHQLMPKILLRSHSVSRVTGYSSGAAWTNAATSSTDRFGHWQPSRIDASRHKGHISGQTFYEMQEILLCPSCEDQYQEDLRNARERLIWILAVIVISVVLFVGIVYLNNR